MTPRDWLPRYQAGDPRNGQHRADYDFYRRRFPDAPFLAQAYADSRAERREQNSAGGGNG